MASPAAAGMALLIRQYFTDTTNRFWTGICNTSYRSCKAFSPSGALVKALLIHSGSAMSLYNGGGTKNVYLGPPPDNMQGWGRVTLQNILPLKNVITNFDLFVAEAVNIGENSKVSYTVKVLEADHPLM